MREPGPPASTIDPRIMSGEVGEASPARPSAGRESTMAEGADRPHDRRSQPPESTMVRADTRELLKRLFDALDWAALGEIYCDEGGEAFWREHRRPARIAGLGWADALASRLPPGGRSLYVGAGVAELPAMIAERRELGRTVVATNLRARECEVLDA